MKRRRPVVALLAKPAASVRAPLARAAARLARAGAQLRLDRESARLLGRRSGRAREAAVAGADLVVCIGGDGTLISAARALNGAAVPLLGINAGSLGFLTETRLEEMDGALRDALAGRLKRETRLLLDAAVRRRGRLLARYLCLNDVVITKGALARIITLHAEVDGAPLTDYRADGLIVATPTGSTAYNLAVGGPIVAPGADCVVLAPIAPHALTQRPLVLPASARLQLTVVKAPRPGRHDTIYLTADGQAGLPLRPGDTVTVARHPGALHLLSPRRPWFRLLREKLQWGESPVGKRRRG